MSDTLKQILTLAPKLTYEEVEALFSALHSINYQRKGELEKEIKAMLAV